MKFTNQALVDLAGALGALDGAVQADGTRKPYKLPWKATYAIARNTATVKPLIEAFEKARMAEIAKFSGGRGGVSPADPKFIEAQEALRPLLELTVEFDPHRFKLSELRLEENEKAGTPIPGSILSALLPIIEDDSGV